MTDLLAGFSRDQLLGSLSSSVAAALNTLDAQGADLNIGVQLLAAAPTQSVSLKGPGRFSVQLGDAVRAEMRAFLCTDAESYNDLREQWQGLREKGSSIAVAALSGAIGAKLGVASGVLAPMVIWILLVALRIGKNALCSALAPQPAPPASPPVTG